MPQNHDPNVRYDPLDMLNRLIASLVEERAQMRTLIADMRTFLAKGYPMDTALRHEYRTALIERADAILKDE